MANRPLIREQAFGESLDPDKLERLGRYEVYLDRNSCEQRRGVGQRSGIGDQIEDSGPPAGSEMGRRVFVDTIGVIGAGKKCEPANSMSQPVHAGSWQAVMELPDIS